MGDYRQKILPFKGLKQLRNLVLAVVYYVLKPVPPTMKINCTEREPQRFGREKSLSLGRTISEAAKLWWGIKGRSRVNEKTMPHCCLENTRCWKF